MFNFETASSAERQAKEKCIELDMNFGKHGLSPNNALNRTSILSSHWRSPKWNQRSEYNFIVLTVNKVVGKIVGTWQEEKPRS